MFTSVLFALSLSAAAPAPLPALGATALAEEKHAAWAGDTRLSWDELDEVLVTRYAMGREGREALQHVVERKLVLKLAEDAGLEIDEKAVNLRWAELDRQVKAAGEADGLMAQLRRNRVDPEYFRTMLGIALLHEELARRALGKPEGARVGTEAQQVWMQQVLAERGLDAPRPPWKDGIAARCGDDLTVSAREYVDVLRRQLPLDDVRETCFQLLLADRAAAKMPDLSPEAFGQAIERELDRRRTETLADPRYQGVTYEALLDARGLTIDSMRGDPAVRVAALANLWVDRGQTPESLRDVYESKREYYEDRYGEALRGLNLYLGAVKMPNQLNPRTFEEAEERLRELSAGVRDAAGFEAVVRVHSDDPAARDSGGDTGWITRGDERAPKNIREAIFAALTPEGTLPEGGALVGPVRTSGGCHMFWITKRRPSPPWEEMVGHVHRELRKEFLDALLPRDEVVTYLDVN